MLLLTALIPLPRTFRRSELRPNTSLQLLDSLKQTDARGRLHLGLLLLCLSPLLRLLVLAAIHARRRNWDLVLTVAIVIAAVGLSFVLGLH
ncbi:MAG: DUF1634 domain-containing protein [Candidatus Eisenbacteria bacterium]